MMETVLMFVFVYVCARTRTWAISRGACTCSSALRLRSPCLWQTVFCVFVRCMVTVLGTVRQ